MRVSVISDGQLTYTDSVAATGNVASESFEETLKTATKSLSATAENNYYPYFKEASEKYGVDINLLMAMAKKESEFDANCVSGSGAMGIMQLMPQTAAAMGVNNPMDPYENIMGGAKYIVEKLNMYNGNVPLALAAYNVGSGTVANYGGSVPPSAQKYVNTVLSYMQEGFEAPVVEESIVEEISVSVVPPIEETPIAETPIEETPIAETPVEEVSVVEETPIEEVPVEETPVVEVQVEAKAEETVVPKQQINLDQLLINALDGALSSVINSARASEDSAKEQIGKQLESLLAEFPNHESFDDFVALMNDEIAASAAEDYSSDANKAYAFLGKTNQALQSMLQNKQENNV